MTGWTPGGNREMAAFELASGGFVRASDQPNTRPEDSYEITRES